VSDPQQTIEFLQRYNQWRRGDESIEQPDPTEIGIAIDDAIKCIEQLDRWRELPAKVEGLIPQTNIPLSAAVVRTTALNQVLDLIAAVKGGGA
jgi:hypothetical protein